MTRIIFIFTTISIIAKIIAFGRELVLGYYFGAGEISDVFLLSMVLPVTLFGFVSNGIISGYIPLFYKVKTERDIKRAMGFTNSVLNFCVLICVFLIIIYYGFSHSLMSLFASGFSESTMNMAISFTDVSIWTVICIAITTVVSGYLQANNLLRITAFISVPLNIGVIITVIMSYQMGDLNILPLGFLLSMIFQVIIICGYSYKCGYNYQITLRTKDKYLNLFISNLLMLTIASSVQQINLLIDRTLASTVSVGGLSIFEYGNKINDFVMGLTILPISTAVFPMLAKSVDNITEFMEVLRKCVRLIVIVIMPVTLIIFTFSEVIVDIIYGRGAFATKDISIVAGVVRFLAVGLIAFSLRELLIKCFYAMGKVRLAMLLSTIGIVINIILNFILIKVMGLSGLAFATSISAFIAVVFFYITLHEQMTNLIHRELKLSIIICVASFIISRCSLFVYEQLNLYWNSVFVSFMISILMFMLIYISVLFVLKIVNITEIRMLINK